MNPIKTLISILLICLIFILPASQAYFDEIGEDDDGQIFLTFGCYHGNTRFLTVDFYDISLCQNHHNENLYSAALHPDFLPENPEDCPISIKLDL